MIITMTYASLMKNATGARMLSKILFAALLILSTLISVSVLIILTCIACNWLIKAVEL